jgi:hypothetical protein
MHIGRWFASARLARVIVVGLLGARGRAGQRAVEIARAVAATGARVEMVGVAAADIAGDATLLELAAADVRHATVIRSDADGLEPADIDLALHYLPDIRGIVLVEPAAALIEPAVAAATWSESGLVVIGPVDEAATAALDAAGDVAIVLDPPASDPDGTFAGFVAALAARLDAGRPPADAWRETLSGLAADRVG